MSLSPRSRRFVADLQASALGGYSQQDLARSALFRLQQATTNTILDPTISAKIYSFAIEKNPTCAQLYIRRGHEKWKLGHWEAALEDYEQAVKTDNGSYDAHFYKARTLLKLRRVRDAFAMAKIANNLCQSSETYATLRASSSLLIACKQGCAALKASHRTAHRDQLIQRLESLLQTNFDQLHSDPFEDVAAERFRLEQDIAELRTAFAANDPLHAIRPTIPSRLIDPIACEVMNEPVITRAGDSFDKTTITNLIRNGDGKHPYTRDALSAGDLLPNKALKEELDEFLNAYPEWRERSETPAHMMRRNGAD